MVLAGIDFGDIYLDDVDQQWLGRIGNSVSRSRLTTLCYMT